MADDANPELPLEPVEPIEAGSDPVLDSPEPEAKAAEPAKKLSIRESINDAIKKASKPSQKDAAAPGPKAGEKVSTPPQGAAAPTTAMPDAWKAKELSPVWAGLTPAVQAAIVKRESDMQKGVDQLKARHQELDNAVSPYRENIRRFGMSEGQAVDQLFKWQMALAGPDKIRAFVSLLQSHGVDPATFAAAITGGAAPNQQPQATLPPQLQAELEGIRNKLGQYDTHFAQQTRTTAEQTVMGWAKDKPHYDKVKMLMGQFIQSGAVKPTEGDPFALDAAYNMAVHANAETRELVAQEARAKEDAERKAVADKARKAGASMRTGAPVPPAASQANGVAKRNEAVRDSIKRALAELRQQ